MDLPRTSSSRTWLMMFPGPNKNQAVKRACKGEGGADMPQTTNERVKESLCTYPQSTTAAANVVWRRALNSRDLAPFRDDQEGEQSFATSLMMDTCSQPRACDSLLSRQAI